MKLDRRALHAPKNEGCFKSKTRTRAQLKEVEIPEVGSADVLIKVRTASICGSDLHIY